MDPEFFPGVFPIIIGYMPYVVTLLIGSGLLLIWDGQTYKHQKLQKESKICLFFAKFNMITGFLLMAVYWIQSFI